MNNKKLISQIKSLAAIKPADRWREQNRQFLLSQIKTETEPALMPEWQSYIRWFGFKIPQLALRPAGIIILASAVALGSGIFVVSAAQSSLPGDTLYPVKITGEKVYSTLLTNPDDNLGFGISFANRRLEEMKQINQSAESTEKKQARVAKAAGVLNRNLKNIQNNLEVIKNKDGSVSQVAEVAQLNEAVSKESAAVTTAVKGTMDEAFTKSLEIMVDQYQNSRLDYKVKEEILKIINVSIVQTSEKIRMVLADLDACCQTAVGSEEVRHNLEPVAKLLIEAKRAMVISDVVLAVAQIKQSRDLIGLAEQKIKDIEQALLMAVEEQIEETASTTAVIIK